jgi:hypothetical protein
MKLVEFQLLQIQDQISTLYKHGVYIGKRKRGHLTILLYQIESFYVEVVYRMYRRHIAKIKCSESTVVLDPYLEQIHVEHLVG